MAAQNLVNKPKGSFSPGKGLLRAEHFQVAYVTNDIERACEIFRNRYGISAFVGRDAKMPTGDQMHIELAWVGGIMIEVIQAIGPGMEFYNKFLSPAFEIKHHHFGYLVHDIASWTELQDEIQRGGWPIAFEGKAEGFMQFCYIEAQELGHYLEYFLLGPDGVAFFESVPVS